MATVDLINQALYKIGVSQGTVDLDTDASREATTAAALYDTHLRACLRRFPWPFATKYADLYLVRGPVFATTSLVQAWSSTNAYVIGDVVVVASVNYRCILAHTNHTPPNSTYWDVDASTDDANGDWTYGYREPSDCVFERRILSDAGLHRKFDPNPVPFRKGTDANGLLIFTDKEDATLEYTFFACDAIYADDLFINYFTWDLAAAFAPSLSRNGLSMKECLAAAELAYMTAATVASREQQQEKPGDAEWISGR